MAEQKLTPHQIIDALRQCGGTIVCEGCPFTHLGTARCIQIMQQDAAEMIEGRASANEKLGGTVEKLRKFIHEK